MTKPLMIDLYAGLGGWAQGGLAEGYDVIGFDIEQHIYDEHRYPAQLVVQDVMTLHGSQFRGADLIVASPPCQEYSWMAMPWSRAKAHAAMIRADKTGTEMTRLTALFDACFRLQREACAAAGHHIPMVVENVKGAQPWVGRARWSFGSFYLWGDVPALMPIISKAVKVGGLDWKHPDDPRHRPGQAFNPAAQGQAMRDARATNGVKVPSFRFDGSGGSFQTAATKRTAVGKGARFTTRDCGLESSGIKQPDLAPPGSSERDNGLGGPGTIWFQKGAAGLSSKSSARKMASAMIAKIPIDLSRHIAASYHP